MQPKIELAKIALDTGKIDESKKMIDDILATNSSYDDANVFNYQFNNYFCRYCSTSNNDVLFYHKNNAYLH